MNDSHGDVNFHIFRPKNDEFYEYIIVQDHTPKRNTFYFFIFIFVHFQLFSLDLSLKFVEIFFFYFVIKAEKGF